MALHAAYEAERLPEKIESEYPSQQKLTFNHLAILEKLFISFGVVDYQEWMPKKAGLLWTLFQAPEITNETLDQACTIHMLDFGRSYNMDDIFWSRESLVKVFYAAFQKNSS